MWWSQLFSGAFLPGRHLLRTDRGVVDVDARSDAYELARLRTTLIERTDQAHVLTERERIDLRIQCGGMSLAQLQGALASIQRREIIASQREHLVTGSSDLSAIPRVMRAE